MKICYSFDSPVPNTGADTEQVVNNVAALARRGVAMSLLVPGPVTGPADPAPLHEYYQVRGDFALHHLALRWRGLRGPEKWSHARRAAHHPAAREADLVYTRNLPGAWAMLRAGHRVVYEHFRPWGDQVPPLQPFLRGVLRHPALVAAIFHSAHAQQSYHRLGVPDDRMLVAHNGWDPGRMEPRLTQAEARVALKLPPHRFTVVYSGRMNARKGLEILLAAADQAPEIGFVLIGSEGEGPVERAARAHPNVTIVPWLKFRELAPWLYAADVLIVPPSLAPLERHGNTVLPIKLFLYLAAGRVLLAPRAPDTAELLHDRENAALVAPGDVAGTVATLRGIAADPGRARVLSAGALATAQHLTWDARAARIADFLAARLAAPPSTLPVPDPWHASAWLGESLRWALGR
ncbi:MAG: glycosyltransferase family 4 protein [Gemmatimonadetes bacterium]|nr:glycosyltransferase family 4 protein [Gemmatimonadota bacterium]MBK7784985.1 glycosyltransferase family 4 protein [Gemmatimonadota bacterium]MBK9066928.1 glycosyltransferase family 4 protein [Gemmatimonadota bacterium]